MYRIHFFVIEWKKKDSKICVLSTFFGASLKEFGTFQEAQSQCIKDENCVGISDKRCEEPNNKLYSLCNSKTTKMVQNTKGCTYEKPG